MVTVAMTNTIHTMPSARHQHTLVFPLAHICLATVLGVARGAGAGGGSGDATASDSAAKAEMVAKELVAMHELVTDPAALYDTAATTPVSHHTLYIPWLDSSRYPLFRTG